MSCILTKSVHRGEELEEKTTTTIKKLGHYFICTESFSFFSEDTSQSVVKAMLFLILMLECIALCLPYPFKQTFHCAPKTAICLCHLGHQFSMYSYQLLMYELVR